MMKDPFSLFPPSVRSLFLSPPPSVSGFPFFSPFVGYSELVARGREYVWGMGRSGAGFTNLKALASDILRSVFMPMLF